MNTREMAGDNGYPQAAGGCPTCGRARTTSVGSNKYFPFCSQRCKLVDLGAWLDAEYRIASTENEDDDEMEGGRL